MGVKNLTIKPKRPYIRRPYKRNPVYFFRRLSKQFLPTFHSSHPFVFVRHNKVTGLQGDRTECRTGNGGKVSNR